MLTQEDTGLEKQLGERKTALKKFTRKGVGYSNYIHEKFYTNQYIVIVDPFFQRIQNEKDRTLDIKKESEKLERSIGSFIEKFKVGNYSEKVLDKVSFKEFETEMKKISLDQLEVIEDGNFRAYDTTGRLRWDIYGKTEFLEGIKLNMGLALFKNILNYLKTVGSDEVKIRTFKDKAIFVNNNGVRIYLGGVIFEEKAVNTQWKLL